MDNDLDRSALIIIVAFGALAIGGLMAASIAFDARDAFLFALGAATAAWGTGYAMLFQRPSLFRWLLVVAVLMAILATAVLVF